MCKTTIASISSSVLLLVVILSHGRTRLSLPEGNVEF